MNNLAYVGEIIYVESILGADCIHLVQVDCLGGGAWTGVVPKEIVMNQKVMVFLPDALLPPGDERFAFMQSRGYRVRQVRFKGCPSEVLILPNPPTPKVGTDITVELGVEKYTKEQSAAVRGIAKSYFPEFIKKTDEPNFQGVRNRLQLMESCDWYVTQKADGSSMTVYNDADGMHVCSRNLELVESDSLFWKMARKYSLDRIQVGFALQMEVVGPGIQKNPLGLAENEVRAFSLWDIKARKYMPLRNLVSACGDVIPMTTFVEYGNGWRTNEELRKMAEIVYPNGKPGEGIVVRATDSTWSFKVINLLYKD